MNEPTQEESHEIADELRQLGQNLREALRSVWESPERQKVQQEIQDGLSELGNTLSQAAKDFSNTPTGQTLKTDLDDLGERLRSGKVEDKIQSEIVNALKIINRELQRAVQHERPPDEPDKP